VKRLSETEACNRFPAFSLKTSCMEGNTWDDLYCSETEHFCVNSRACTLRGLRQQQSQPRDLLS
jgi:hypothetical protein